MINQEVIIGGQKSGKTVRADLKNGGNSLTLSRVSCIIARCAR